MKKFVTDIISEHLGKVKYKNLPNDVIEKAKICILDSIGCTLGGSTTSVGEIVISSSLHAKERGLSTIFGCKKKTSLTNAVFINSTLSNILDFDDVYIGHPGATIIPVALNVSENTNVSGKELITAVVLAYEIGIRMGLGLRPTVERKYIHGLGTWQVFGAVVAASKLLKLNTEEIANALSIAGANAPLPSAMKTVYGLTGPTMVKNNYGTASEVGVRSTFLASSGFTGPKDIFSGETGFWRMIGTDYSDLGKILNKNFGIEYRILNNAFKPYPCCRLIHSSIDAILNVVNNNDINLSDIEKILIKTVSLLHRPPFSIQAPENMNMFKGEFNAPYAITCALRNIEPLEWYERKNMLDKSLLEITKKIEFEVDSNADKLFRKNLGTIPATAIIYLKNGKDYHKEVLIPKGDPRNPLTLEDLIKKFKRLALKALNNECQVMSLINMIMKLEKIEDVNKLTKMLSQT